MRGMTRSIELFKGFRNEQQDPVSFYKLLADDAVREISRYSQLTGAKVIDIGGASGYVGDAMVDAGASAMTVEYDWDQIVEHGRHLQHGIQADGLALPIFDAAFDVAYSSNVLEHVPDAQQMLREMVRVVCPGGLVFVNFTNWLSPWGGHETAPWHYFGGEWAAARYERHYGEPPKNRYGLSLHKLSIGSVLRWAKECADVQILEAYPRYYPHWTAPLVRIPGLREVATWNLTLVLRRRTEDTHTTLTSIGGSRRMHLQAPGRSLVKRTPVGAAPGGGSVSQ
jgi:SAM-dependent methyltransferase